MGGPAVQRYSDLVGWRAGGGAKAHARTSARAYARTHARSVRTHTCTHVRAHTCTHARAHTCTHARARSHMHARARAHMHARAHICTRARARLVRTGTRHSPTHPTTLSSNQPSLVCFLSLVRFSVSSDLHERRTHVCELGAYLRCVLVPVLVLVLASDGEEGSSVVWDSHRDSPADCKQCAPVPVPVPVPAPLPAGRSVGRSVDQSGRSDGVRMRFLLCVSNVFLVSNV